MSLGSLRFLLGKKWDLSLIKVSAPLAVILSAFIGIRAQHTRCPRRAIQAGVNPAASISLARVHAAETRSTVTVSTVSDPAPYGEAMEREVKSRRLPNHSK
jgi:hypothetical protein